MNRLLWRGSPVATLPNALSLSRLVCAPTIGVLLAMENHPHMALGLYAAAAITDFADGQIARRMGSRSAIGSFLDPAADKALAVASVGGLWWAAQLPGWLCGLVLGRDIALGVGWLLLGNGKHSKRGESVENAKEREFVKPSMISKANTALQMALVTLILARRCVDDLEDEQEDENEHDHEHEREHKNEKGNLISIERIQNVLEALVGTTTVASGIAYALRFL